jgi:hypothetical protein
MGSGWAAEALAELRASRRGRGIVCAIGVQAGGRLPVIASVWPSAGAQSLHDPPLRRGDAGPRSSSC